MKRTISAMRGPGSLNHNRRSFTAENVDPKRSSLNVVYRDEPIQKVYHELFDEAVKRYNAKQKRKDRCITDYYEHLRTGKQEKLFHELIVQIGNKDDMGVLTENGALAKELLDEYMQGFKNGTRHCGCSERSSTWTKLRPICTSTSCRMCPAGRAKDWTPRCP